MLGDDVDHQGVSHQSDQHDEGEEERDQPGVCEERVLIAFLLFVSTSCLGEIPLGAVDPDLLRGVPQLRRGVHYDRTGTGRMMAREEVEEVVVV